MSLSEELKPCPFCGCDGWIVEDRGDHSCEPLLYRPQCKMCGGGLGGFQYRDNAIMVWNTRAAGVAALQQAGEQGWVLVPRDPTEEQCFAARGLLLSLSFGAPNYQTSLGEVAASGYYGEVWGHILTDEERAIKAPLTKGHRARLIYRAMLSAAPLPQQTALVEQGVEKIIGPHEPAACGASAPSEAPSDDGWRDIATAPHDGTPVLVWCGEYRVARFHAHGTRWGSQPSWGDEDGDVLCGPDRWMSLPAPPQDFSATASAYRAFGKWMDRVAVTLEGDTDEIDMVTWTEWFAEGLTADSAAGRYDSLYNAPLPANPAIGDELAREGQHRNEPPPPPPSEGEKP